MRQQPSFTRATARVQRQRDLLTQLIQALSDMRPVTELGTILADNLRRCAALSSMILAPYDPAQHVLSYATVVLDGQFHKWPVVTPDDHPFSNVLHKSCARRINPACLTRHTWLALPLQYGGITVGVLAVSPLRQGQRYRHLLNTCANLLATAIFVQQHLERLGAAFTDQASALAGISDTGQQLNGTLDRQQIVDLLLMHALGATSARAGLVLLCTEQNRLMLQAQHGLAPSVAAPVREHTLSVTEFAQIDLDRQYQVVAAERVPASLQAWSTQQAIVPIRREEHLLGLLIMSIDAGQAISATEVRFLEQLAAHAALALTNARAFSEIDSQRQLLDHRLAQLQVVLRISQAISAHLNLAALLPEIVTAVETTVGYRCVLLSLVDEAQPALLRRAAAVGIPDPVWQELRDEVVPLANYQPLMTEEFRINRSYYIPHDHDRLQDLNVDELLPGGYRADLGDRQPGEWHADDLLFVPLYGHHGALVGVLSVDDPLDQRRPTPETITILEILATQAATAIENARLYAAAEQQALTDNLTGLANQRHFMMHLAQHVAWAERHGHDLAVLALDIDHFKAYNDHYGHLVGNLVLREFAEVLRNTVRAGDLVARWGGEEFCAILPQSTLENALDVAERIRAAVRKHTFPYRAVSVSVGVATFLAGMHDHEVLAAADAALYRAKRRRDTVST